MNRRGAFSIVGLMLSVIALIIYVALLPVMNQFISDAVPQLDSMTALVIQLFPLIILIMIIIGVISYGKPDYEYVG